MLELLAIVLVNCLNNVSYFGHKKRGRISDFTTVFIDPQKRSELEAAFEDIEEDFAFGTKGYTVIPCCQGSLRLALLCIYRMLCCFYDLEHLFEYIYFKGKVIYLDTNELDFGKYGDYSREEIVQYLENYILGSEQ